MDDSDLSEPLAGTGWQTFEEAFGEQAELARELAGEHRAHRMGELISPALAGLVRRQLRALINETRVVMGMAGLSDADVARELSRLGRIYKESIDAKKRGEPPKVIPLTPAELSWVASLPHPETAP
jgi:hypothetical protein